MPLFGKNVEFHPFKKHGAWRKIAMGTWDMPGDPSIIGKTELDATEILRAIEATRSEGLELKPLHFVSAALAKAIAKTPKANGVVRFGRTYYRKDTHICIPVMADETGDELTAIIIRNADQKSVRDIAREVNERTNVIRSGEDEEFESTKKLLGILPGWFIHPLLRFLGFVYYTLNIWIGPLGIPRDSFGSAQVTSLSGFGVLEGWGPLDPYSRCPVNVILGQIQKRPIALEDHVIVRPMAALCYTFDHRVADAVVFSRLGIIMKKILESPGAGL